MNHIEHSTLRTLHRGNGLVVLLKRNSRNKTEDPITIKRGPLDIYEDLIQNARIIQGNLFKTAFSFLDTFVKLSNDEAAATSCGSQEKSSFENK
jgi:hypothetical protein